MVNRSEQECLLKVAVVWDMKPCSSVGWVRTFRKNLFAPYNMVIRLAADHYTGNSLKKFEPYRIHLLTDVSVAADTQPFYFLCFAYSYSVLCVFKWPLFADGHLTNPPMMKFALQQFVKNLRGSRGLAVLLLYLRR